MTTILFTVIVLIVIIALLIKYNKTQRPKCSHCNSDMSYIETVDDYGNPVTGYWECQNCDK